VSCYPNPANDELSFFCTDKLIFDTVQVLDMKGICVKTFINLKQNKISIRDLLPGTYIIKCSVNGVISEGKFIKK
jgi:hypothetical protein